MLRRLEVAEPREAGDEARGEGPPHPPAAGDVEGREGDEVLERREVAVEVRAPADVEDLELDELVEALEGPREADAAVESQSRERPQAPEQELEADVEVLELRMKEVTVGIGTMSDDWCYILRTGCRYAMKNCT